MRVAYIITFAVVLAATITVIVLWFLGFFAKISTCEMPSSPLLFADNTSMCVPVNRATIIRSKEEFIFGLRPEYRYYLIDIQHVGDDGKVTSMKHAKEIKSSTDVVRGIDEYHLITIPKRESAIYFFVTDKTYVLNQ